MNYKEKRNWVENGKVDKKTEPSSATLLSLELGICLTFKSIIFQVLLLSFALIIVPAFNPFRNKAIPAGLSLSKTPMPGKTIKCYSFHI